MEHLKLCSVGESCGSVTPLFEAVTAEKASEPDVTFPLSILHTNAQPLVASRPLLV